MTRPEQLTIDQVRQLSPEQVDAALRDGKLDDLLGRPNREPQPPPLTVDEVERARNDGRLDELLEARRNWKPTTRERLRTMTPEEIRDATKAGDLDGYLRGRRVTKTRAGRPRSAAGPGELRPARETPRPSATEAAARPRTHPPGGPPPLDGVPAQDRWVRHGARRCVIQRGGSER